MNQLPFEILRSEYMIAESAINMYSNAALQFLAGKEISTGFFSKLLLPDVPNSVALIAHSGVMTKADVCGAKGTRTLSAEIMAAANDPSKNAILIYWENVPGGQVDGTEALGQSIAAAKTKKPVISMTSGLTASAGVWAASQSTEWYATAATDQIGCIGVMARISKKNESDGYEVVYSDLSPDKNEESRSTEAYKQNFLNPAAELFQNAVKAGRGSKLKADAPGVLSGRTFIAGAAKSNGLIDGIMPMDRVIKRAAYLGKKNSNNTTMSTATNGEGQFVFQNILTAAGATAAVPVEEGFALTEEQMTALDNNIAATAQQLAAATENNAALQTQLTEANAALTAANTAKETAEGEVAALTARIAVLEKKPAHVADPAAAADPVTEKGKYHTSYDDEIAAQKKRLNIA